MGYVIKKDRETRAARIAALLTAQRAGGFPMSLPTKVALACSLMVRYVETLTNDFRSLAVGHSPDQVYVELKQSIDDDGEFASFDLTLHLPDCCAYLGQFFEIAIDSVIPAEFLEDSDFDVTISGSHWGDCTLHPEFSIEPHLRSNVRESGDAIPEWFQDCGEIVEGCPNGLLRLH